MFDLDILVVWFQCWYIINKRLGSRNTTIYFDIVKKEIQLHVSARGHRQVGSFGLREEILSATPC
jgi:hypothetical protein